MDKYTQEQREEIIKYRNDGFTYPQIAELVGIPFSSSIWRICHTDHKGHYVDDTTKQRILKLRRDGLTYPEICKIVGRSAGCCRDICISEGLTKTPTENRKERIIRLRVNDHLLYEQIAEIVGCTKNIVQRVCHEEGVTYTEDELAYVHGLYFKSETAKKQLELQRNLALQKIIDKLGENVEYVGGYQGKDGKITLRCRICGHTFERSAQQGGKAGIRFCPLCKAKEIERLKEQRDKERNIKQEQQLKEREEKRKLKEQELKRKEQERIEKTVDRVCRVCGKTFKTWQNKKCCSAECSQKYADNKRDYRIPMNKRISVGITAKSLYKRDNGTCWICGGKCDLNDYVTRDGVFIAGDWYPSVDHIVPIVDGGEHSWENVKLAHRICNSRRYYAEKGTLRS